MTRNGRKMHLPALQRLGQNGRRQRHIPWVQQMHSTDCGAACLTMALHYFGREQPFEEVRERMGSSRDGINARTILEGASKFGLRGRGIRLEMEDLHYLPPAAILHWQFKHFVVFEKLTKSGVFVLDPAIGRRCIPLPEFSRSFTGVALVLEPAADFEPLATPHGRMGHSLRHMLRHSGLFAQVLLATAMLQLLGLGLPLLTGMLVDRIIPRGDYDMLLILVSGVVVITVFSLLTSLVRSFLLLQLRTQLDARMSLDFLEHLVRLPYSFFQLRQTGDLMMRLNSNTTIRELLTSSVLSGILDGAAVVGYLLLLLFTNWRIGLLVMVLGSLRVLVFLLTRRRLGLLAVESVMAQSRSSSYQVQMLEGIESLKSAGAERQSVDRWSHLFVDTLNVSVVTGRVTAYIDACFGALNSVSPLLILGYGGALVMQGQLSLGSMLALNALALGFLTPLSSLAATGLQLQRLGSYVDRVEDVLRQQPEQESEAVRAAPPLRGAVSLQGVAFRYSENGPWALQDIEVEVRPGEHLAIVGRSGSGKSTLARLLVGLYRPVAGRILYDGHDLGELEFCSVRRQIGFVPQFPYVFSASIRENIALRDPQMPLEQVVRAAELASIHDEILLLPLGYETLLVGGGAAIAGGQRQRIALARALVNEPPILVLDEATSHLDAVAEARVGENLRSLRATQIVVAHRLSTVRDADRILVMDAGRIVEQGAHFDLLARHGAYAALVAGQLQSEARAG